MTTVVSDVIQIIAKHARGGRTDVQLGDRLADLGIESIDAIEMIFDLEEKFDIQIPYNVNDAQPEFETVGDIVGAIQRLVTSKA
jgi:acyl carrier protein